MMFGVVLWCDGNSAVGAKTMPSSHFIIWAGRCHKDKFELQVGDLVKFDVQLGELQLASNIAFLSATEYRSLARDLVARTKGIGVAHMTGSQVDPSGNHTTSAAAPILTRREQTA